MDETTMRQMLDAVGSVMTRAQVEERLGQFGAQLDVVSAALHEDYVAANARRDERFAEWRAEDMRLRAKDRAEEMELHASERDADLARVKAERDEHDALQARMHRAEIAARLLARIPYGVENAQAIALDEADHLIAACTT